MGWKTLVVMLRQLVMGWTPLKLKPEPRNPSAGLEEGWGCFPSGIIPVLPLSLLPSAADVEAYSDGPQKGEGGGQALSGVLYSRRREGDPESSGPGSPQFLAPSSKAYLG